VTSAQEAQDTVAGFRAASAEVNREG
jgi:hypothetical protein